MATGKQNRDFEQSIFEDAPLLDRSIDWIKVNMTIGQIFTEEDIKSYVEDSSPEDYFAESKLKQWAEDNGFVKPE